MSVLVPLLTDNFNRPPESPIGPPWQAWGWRRLPPLVEGGVVFQDASGSDSWMHRKGEVIFGPNQYQRLTVPWVGTSSRPVLCLRMTGDFNNIWSMCGYHGAVINSNYGWLRRMDSGTWTTLTEAIDVGSATIDVRVVGTQLVLMNHSGNAPSLAATDATYAGGDATLVGLERHFYHIDDWEAGIIQGGGGAAGERGLWRGVWRGIGRGV